MPDFRTPPALDRGDKVAIVAPASGLAAAFPHVYERGLERLRSVFDLEPVEFPTATATDDYLAANPAERARDVTEAFADPEIAGVVTTIGGNDQIRILEHLDPSVLRANPTRFFGISDNTNLSHYLWNQGIVSFYGGHVLTELAVPGAMPDYLETGLETAFFEDEFGAIEPAPTFTDEDGDWEDPDGLEDPPAYEDNPGWEWRGGSNAVAGRTWGGSFEITALQLLADRYAPPLSALAGGVLLLETSEELPSPGMVSRDLRGMGERGVLGAVDAVLVGRIKARSHREHRSAAERATYRERVRDTMADVLTDYNPTAPLVFGVDFGHTSPIVPVPIGATARVDPAAETVAFELP